MKILYICGTYCPAHGGAEISMHTLLKFVKKDYGAQILVLTDNRYTQNKARSSYDTITLLGSSYQERKKNIQKAISVFKPNLIITQLMWSNEALRIGKKNGIPTILRICKIPFELDLSKGSKFSPTGLMGISKAVKKYIKEKWNRDCSIDIPAIELKRNILIPKSKFIDSYKREYITMFNPLVRKGGIIFKEISQKMPEEKFATVQGWSSLKETVKSKTFSNRLIKRMCESQGTKFTGKKLNYVDFSDCPNVTILEPTEKVWKIYSKTKLLLIPSQWEEAFGRVTIEGMANSIPVMGSSTGGLKEAIGMGGILVKRFSNSDKWLQEIKRLENKKYYKRISSNGVKWVKENYSLDRTVKNTFNFFKGIINKSNRLK